MALLQEVVDTCSGLSRFEPADTVRELLDWKRPAGGLKMRECQDFLELLELLESKGVKGSAGAGGDPVLTRGAKDSTFRASQPTANRYPSWRRA